MPDRDPTVSEYLYHRRIKAGWSTERAASKPSQKRKPTIRVRGETTSVAETRTKAGVGYSTYHSRLRLGWSKARAASTPRQLFRRRDTNIPVELEYKGETHVAVRLGEGTRSELHDPQAANQAWTVDRRSDCTSVQGEATRSTQSQGSKRAVATLGQVIRGLESNTVRIRGGRDTYIY